MKEKFNLIDNFLNEKGYHFLENLYGGYVNLREKNGQKVVSKNMRDLYKVSQPRRESEILKIISDERLPKKIDFFSEELKNYVQELKSTFNTKEIANQEIILKEYIEGKIYNNEQLSTYEEQKIINLIKKFHKEGFTNLDIVNENFILTPKKELYFVDFGWAKNKKELKKEQTIFIESTYRDLSDLEKMLKKSI